MADEPIEVNLDDLLAHIAPDLSADASADEAAAVAVAVGAHLSDRERAAASAATDEPELVSPWTFAARMARNHGRGPAHPQRVERGDEWRAASRTR